MAISLNLTIGSLNAPSPYDIGSFQDGIKQTGATVNDASILEISIDSNNKIICAPCYMMEASVLAVRLNIQSALLALKQLI